MIDKGLFDAYAEALNVNAELTRAACSELVERLQGVANVDLRGELLRFYPALVKTYGRSAASIAAEFYTRQRGIAAPDEPYEPLAFDAGNAGFLPFDIDDALKSADVGERLASSAIQRTNEYADATITVNAKRDPAKPKWALVPHAGACGWCRLMGSQGFTYASERSARDVRHPDCKCDVVVDFDTDNPSLDGYDVDALGDQYIEARDAVEDDARSEWDAMSGAERDEFRRTHKVKGRNDFDIFLRNKMISHMNKAR